MSFSFWVRFAVFEPVLPMVWFVPFMFSSSLVCLSRLLRNVLVFSQRSQTRLGPRGGIFWYFARLQTFKRVVFCGCCRSVLCFLFCFCMFLYSHLPELKKQLLVLISFIHVLASKERKGDMFQSVSISFNLIHWIRSLFWTVWLTVISSLNHDGATFTWNPRQVPCLRKRKDEKM